MPPLRRLVLLAAILATVSACGATEPRVTLSECLNDNGFLVEGTTTRIAGSSAGGVNFTLTIYGDAAAARRARAGMGRRATALIGNAVVDYSGNPSATPASAPGKLSKDALATIRTCLESTA